MRTLACIKRTVAESLLRHSRSIYRSLLTLARSLKHTRWRRQGISAATVRRRALVGRIFGGSYISDPKDMSPSTVVLCACVSTCVCSQQNVFSQCFLNRMCSINRMNLHSQSSLPVQIHVLQNAFSIELQEGLRLHACHMRRRIHIHRMRSQQNLFQL